MKFVMLPIVVACSLIPVGSLRAAEEYIEKGHIEEMFYDTTVKGYWTTTGKTTYAYFAPDNRLYYDSSPYPVYFADWFINEKGAVCTKDRNRTCMYVADNNGKIIGKFRENGVWLPVVTMDFTFGDSRNLAKRANAAEASQRNYENQRALAITALLGAMILSGGGSSRESGKTRGEEYADDFLARNADRGARGQ